MEDVCGRVWSFPPNIDRQKEEREHDSQQTLSAPLASVETPVLLRAMRVAFPQLGRCSRRT